MVGEKQERLPCPYCGVVMTEMSSVNKWETEKHCYVCRREECDERPIYRRIDKATEERSLTQGERIRAAELRELRALSVEVNGLTRWMRNNRPELLVGGSGSIVGPVLGLLDRVGKKRKGRIWPWR